MTIGRKILLMGPPGSGKTHATTTLAKTGQRVVHLLLEPGGLPVLQKAYGPDVPSNVHWHQLDVPGASLDELDALAMAMNTRDGDDFARWKPDQKYRGKHDGITRIQKALRAFPSQQGKLLESAESWGPDTTLVIDSLTALCDLVWNQSYGGRTAIEPGDYTKSQGYLDVFFGTICQSWKCNLVVTAHVEPRAKVSTVSKESEMKLFPVLIGGKMRAMFGKYFSEVILAKRLGAKWYWDTQAGDADVKCRELSASSTLEPDFAQLFKKA